jgi:MinD superfamily P-loop ATPase
MRFTRFVNFDTDEDFWLCENCVDSVDDQAIDSANDTYGDKTCERCGACYDNDYEGEEIED